jgi:RNA polymerase sigma-70 factor (ECF subfamily)
VLRSRTRRRADAIEREVLPHMDALYGYGLYLTRNRTEAEELTQETLLKAVNAFSQYQEGTNCKAWLFRIMHNTFLNSIRKKQIPLDFEENALSELAQREDLKTFVNANRTPEESFVSMLSRAKVREAVETLPPEFKSVVILADLEGFAYKEIAEILSVPIGTVMSRLHRGRKLLRVRLLGWAREMGLVDVADDADEGASEPLPEPENVTPLASYRRMGNGPGNGEEEQP